MNFEQNYQNNMQLLKKGWSFIYNKILEADISEYELTETTSGDYNISINGKKLYPDNMEEAITQQIDTFIKKPTSFYKKPSWSADNGKEYEHDKVITEIEKDSPFLNEKIPFSDYHHNLDGYLPFVLAIGIGSGKYIEELIKKSNGISDIIIIDQSYEFLKISFHLMDWKPIFTYFLKNHRGLQFVIDNDYKQVANSTLNVLFKNYPYHFFNVSYLTHYNSDFFNNVKKEFLGKINLGFTGLGFFDDEIIGITHTIENIQNNRAVYRWNKPLPDNSVAFIIGSGPSLDEDIEQIKKHKDKAIIFSAGSALSSLYANDIIPDFHMIQERIGNIKYLEDNLPKEYLKKIDVICLNVVEPETLALFKSAKILFRENDAGASIVPSDIPKLKHTNPTVVNATLSFTSEIGFRNIFLFGTDMGFRNAKNHHSKSSSYYSINPTGYGTKVDNKQYAGNFNRNESFLSTNILEWCKQRAENCIMDFLIQRKKAINYFNCSDGLYIQRCTPIRSHAFQIDKNLDKNKVIKAINDNFDSDFKHLAQEIKTTHQNELKRFNNDIKSVEKLLMAKKITSFEQFFILIKRTYTVIGYINNEHTSYLTRSMLKGTMYHFYISVYTHALAGTHKDQSINYINESIQKLLNFLKIAKNKVDNIILK